MCIRDRAALIFHGNLGNSPHFVELILTNHGAELSRHVVSGHKHTDLSGRDIGDVVRIGAEAHHSGRSDPIVDTFFLESQLVDQILPVVTLAEGRQALIIHKGSALSPEVRQYRAHDGCFVSGRGIDTVSYTHLDVYKRQAYYYNIFSGTP